MATMPPTTSKRRPLDALYPAEYPRKPHRRGVIDDTLDIHPPVHLFEGISTPEELEAAKRLAAERGYALPATSATPPSPPGAANGVPPIHDARPKRAAEARGEPGTK